MPPRKIPLVEDYIYHVLNRGVNRIPIFKDKRDYLRFLEATFYYRFINVPLRFSLFRKLKSEEKSKILTRAKNKLVDFIAYCLMPNHFHFVLKQLTKDGISLFVARLTNSYGKYFNIRHKRQGPLFQGRFKAVLVEDEAQLIHLVRYVHLNPYVSLVIKAVDKIEQYSWSSFREYLGGEEKGQLVETKDLILSFFKSQTAFKKFTIDQADYARQLEIIKHLALEEI